MENDQFTEEQSEPNFEHVLNQGPLHVQETFTPTEQANNSLSIGAKPIKQFQPNPIELAQVKHVYIFLEMSIAYA